MTKVKKLIVAVIVLSTATGGFLWWTSQTQDANGLTLYGNVELRDAQLAFREQERIAEVLVEEGETVEQGQILARLEQDRLTAQLAEAEAALTAQQEVTRRLTTGTRPQEIEQAVAEVAAAQARMKNYAHLVQRLTLTTRDGASIEQDLDDARAEMEVARAELSVRREALDLAREGFRDEEIAEARAVLRAREAQLTYLQERLDDTVLHAPAVGVIQSRILEPGEMAMPARPALVLALTDPKWVRAYLPEPDLGHIRDGMTAQVYSDSFPDRVFDGQVGFISPLAEFTPKSVQTTDLRTQLVYEIRIWVDDPANELRLGMPVTVEIAGSQALAATSALALAASNAEQ